MSILIKNIYFVPMSGSKNVDYGAVLIEGNKIKRLFRYQPGETGPDVTAEETVDGDGQLLIPGLTNAHYHSYSNAIKGTECHYPLEIWSLYTVAYGHAMTEEDLHLAALLGAAEMIKNGITACIDHFPHLMGTEAALKAYEQSGLRVSFAPMMHDVPDHRFLGVDMPEKLRNTLEAKPPRTPLQMETFFKELVSRWHNKEDRIQIMLGPNAPQRCSNAMLALCKKLSVKEDLLVHTHLLETPLQRSQGMKDEKQQIIEKLKKSDLVNQHLSVAHAVWLEEGDIDYLADRNVSVIHNPASNFTLGSGKAPIQTYLDKGMSVAIGTDASNCGTQHNLFEAMRLAVMMSRVNERDYRQWLTPEKALSMAIQGGAAVMGQADKRGLIAEGYAADLVLLDTHQSVWAPMHDALTQLVFYENGRSVNSVMINGKWVMKNGDILTFNENIVIRKFQQRQKTLLDNAERALQQAEKVKPYFETFYNKQVEHQNTRRVY